VARELGVCAKTVNRWADGGAVEVVRDAKGRRHFKPEAVQILAARLGLALSPNDCQEGVSNAGAR
jgi:predicted site-specific integrase-resolvase